MLDSVGIGGAPDAAAFGDEGADTLGHIAEWFAEEKGRLLSLPNLQRLGLGEAYRLVHGKMPRGWEPGIVKASYGSACEVSTGKDTPSGHWEMAGVPVTWDWTYYGNGENAFPQDLLEKIYKEAGIKGSLGNKASGGTRIIKELGQQSEVSGLPIFYTSADSVFQIAAHEHSFGLGALYRLCRTIRELLIEEKVGRVIARPFVGEAGAYERTGNRRDFSMQPPRPTVLELIEKKKNTVYGVGKISDIFAHTGVSQELKASGHEDLWKNTREALGKAGDGDLVMTNFVDFDMLFGHRRDPRGYGMALELWDRELGRFINELHEGDLLVITADHGNDPTWAGTDHTREQVPVLMMGAGRNEFGVRSSFSDIGASVAKWLGVEMDEGESMI